MIPGVADIVDPSTLCSADGPVVPCDAVGPADAPVIQYEVNQVIPDAVAPMCDGDPDDVAPKILCEEALEMPAPVIPVPVMSRRC